MRNGLRRCGGGTVFLVIVAVVGGGGCGGSNDAPATRRPAPVAEAPQPQPKPQTRPVARRGNLYERMGGEDVVRAVVGDFVTRAAADPAVNFTRQGHPNEWQATPENIERLKRRLVEFVATTAGGPMQYRGSDMVTAHRGMAITNSEFDALAGHLRAALEANDVPRREREELMSAVASTRGAVVEAGDAPPPPAETQPPETNAPDAAAPDAPIADAPTPDAPAPDAPSDATAPADQPPAEPPGAEAQSEQSQPLEPLPEGTDPQPQGR